MRTMTAVAAAALIALGAHSTRAAELQPATLKAWKAYLKQADARAQQRIRGGQPFLWMDESADRAARVRRGELAIAPLVGHGSESVPKGLIHHWIGAVFIPGATLGSLWAVVHDYDNYQQVYRPAVTSSRMISCAGADQEFQMVWQRRVSFVGAALQGRYQAHDVIVDAHRAYSVAEAVEVREISRYGEEGEHLLPPDTGNGYIWRVRSVARFEERDGGVYLELEALALTRDIPAGLAWMVNPMVNHLSINSLKATLRQTREAVAALPVNIAMRASCTSPSRTLTARGGLE